MFQKLNFCNDPLLKDPNNSIVKLFTQILCTLDGDVGIFYCKYVHNEMRYQFVVSEWPFRYLVQCNKHTPDTDSTPDFGL